MRPLQTAAGLAAGLALLTTLTTLAVADPMQKKVDCDKKQTIGQALEQADGLPMTIIVEGTCQEHPLIARNDVTLVAGPAGATVLGPDPTQNTITVTADRIVIDGLTVTGGRNGIANLGNRVTIRNCVVQATGYIGISFFQGGTGTVDGCTVRNNPRHGIYVESASVTVSNSTIVENLVGVLVSSGGDRKSVV